MEQSSKIACFILSKIKAGRNTDFHHEINFKKTKINEKQQIIINKTRSSNKLARINSTVDAFKDFLSFNYFINGFCIVLNIQKF